MSHWRLSPGIAARSSPTSSRTPGRDRATARQGQTDGAAHESQRGQPIGVGRRAVRGSRYWGTAFEARPSSRVRRLRRRPAPIVVPDCAPQPRARSWPRQTPDTTRARSRPRCHPSTSERPVVVKGWRPPQLESSSPHLNRNRLGPRHRRAHRRHPACLPRQHDQPEARVVEADAPRVLPHDGYQVASFAAPTAPPSLTSRCPPAEVQLDRIPERLGEIERCGQWCCAYSLVQECARSGDSRSSADRRSSPTKGWRAVRELLRRGFVHVHPP